VRAIVFHQLAGRAAQAIFGRLRAAVGELTPEAFNAVSDADLRAAGLSANKLASLRDLSAKVLDGTVVLTRTSRRSDDELIAGSPPCAGSAAGLREERRSVRA
jgi:DNA-3-methyladenine glycosylase II